MVKKITVCSSLMVTENTSMTACTTIYYHKTIFLFQFHKNLLKYLNAVRNFETKYKKSVCGGQSSKVTCFCTILRRFCTILLRLCLVSFRKFCYFDFHNSPFYCFLLMSDLINCKAGT